MIGASRPGGLRVGARRGGTELGQQDAEFAATLTGQQRGHIGGAPQAGELAQHGGERRVGKATRAQLHTAPGEHKRAVPHRPGELPDQPGLAAAGFRADEHGARRPARRVLERARQQRELSLPARENRAHQASGHVPYDASSRPGPSQQRGTVRTAGSP
jgi:hypothetical protein